MPEDKAARQTQPAQDVLPPPLHGGRWKEIAVLMIVMAIEAVIIVFIMNKPRSEDESGGATSSDIAVSAQAHSSDELMAPQLDIPNIIVSIRVDDAGNRLHTLATGIVLKVGKPVRGKLEKDVDLKYLETVYLPKVQKLVPAIRDTIIREVSARTYGELLQSSVRQQILDGIKSSTNRMLESYGLEPRIAEIYWTMWHFN